MAIYCVPNREHHLEGSTNTINASWNFIWTFATFLYRNVDMQQFPVLQKCTMHTFSSWRQSCYMTHKGTRCASGDPHHNILAWLMWLHNGSVCGSLPDELNKFAHKWHNSAWREACFQCGHCCPRRSRVQAICTFSSVWLPSIHGCAMCFKRWQIAGSDVMKIKWVAWKLAQRQHI